MKIVSRLVKMETRLGSLERKGEEILSRSDPTLDTAQTKVYVGPEDLVGMVKLLNSSVVGYLFLFPVFYIVRYLRKIESHKDGVTKLWERTSIFFACMLILGGVIGFDFSTILFPFLVIFSILFLIVALFNKKGDFIYPMAFLQGASIYLLARLISLNDRFVPLLGSVLILIWFLLALRWKERTDITLPLYRSGYWASCFFSYEVLSTFLQGSVDKDHGLAWLAIPLLIFAFYLWVRYFDTQKPYLQYLALAILALAFVLTIFAIPYLPLKYMGSYLVILSMTYTFFGVHYQETWGYERVQPLYRMGVVLASASFFFSLWDVNTFSFNIVLYSALYFESSLRVVPPSSEESEEELTWTLKDLFFVLAILGSIVFSLVYFLFDRPLFYGPIIASLGFGYHLLLVGLGREGKNIFWSRNVWVYVSAFFFSIGFFSLIALLIPFIGIHSLLLTLFPVAVFLGLGFYYGKRGEGMIQTSLYESSYLFVIIAFVWILSQKKVPIIAGLGLILFFAIVYGGLNLKAKDKGLWYSFSFLSVFLSYLLLRYLPGQEFLGFYMSPLGWAFLSLAIYLKRINHTLKDVCHLTWFLFAMASIYELMPRLSLAGPGFILWSLALLVTSMLTWEEERPIEKKIREETHLENEVPAPWRK